MKDAIRKNIWLILGGTMLATTSLILLVRGGVFTRPPLSPDVAQQQLEPLDQMRQELDKSVEQTVPEKLERDQCPYVTNSPGECWIYRIDAGSLIVIKGYTRVADLSIYDLADDGRPDILKWDLDSDGRFDVIEYDVDGDGVFSYARADTNGDGEFENNELYMYQHLSQRWQTLVPGALPFPVLPIFPY